MTHLPAGGSSHLFRHRAQIAIEDARLQEALERATAKFRNSRIDALGDLTDSEEMRDRFKAMRAGTLAGLKDHLEIFTERARASGAQVHWAATAGQACQIVVDIAQRHGVTLATKTKSMATEEIHLNQALQEAGVFPVETDLGEYIIQLANEPPFHILAPATHKTKEQVAALFAEVRGAEAAPGAEDGGQAETGDEIGRLTAEARELLREKFLAAGMGITGANIGIADTGTLVLVTNEGNGEMVTSLPPVQVAIMGVEKIAPTWDDAALWLSLLARSATGQPLSIYTTYITGPARQEDPDGPGELHIILLDNGRSALLGTKYEEALQCIRCGACLNVCPVYREAGGHAYGSPYSGPIGAVISPLLFGLDEFEGLPQASSLCGACLDVCPARIDLPRMLLALRADEVQGRIMPWKERQAERLAATVFGHSWLMGLGTALLRLFQRPFLVDGRLRLPDRFDPTPGRQLPSLAPTPFRALWKDLDGDDAGLTIQPSRATTSFPRESESAASQNSRPHYTDLSSQFAAALTKAGGEVQIAPDLDGALLVLGDYLKQLEVRSAVVNRQPPFDSLDLPGRWPRIRWRVVAESNDASSEKNAFRAFAAQADIGISLAEAALAETGSVAVNSGAGLSRLTALLPPVHLVLVPTSCLTEDIFTWSASREGAPPAALTLISGPSKTGDIEQTLTTGVHGPKRFIAIVYA